MFDYQKWLDLLVKYIVVSNIPFAEVEVPEFVDLIKYTHHGLTKLSIPSSKAIKQRVLQLSNSTIEELKTLFKVCLIATFSVGLMLNTWQKHTGKVSLILDAWTSSNGYAFLAIVARYITADFELGACQETNNKDQYH
jgi:hypothetical protein